MYVIDIFYFLLGGIGVYLSSSSHVRCFFEICAFLHLRVQDAEGVLVVNIGSYMGGVDLWHNEDEHFDNFDPQSIYDKILEVVSVSGTWHLGKLQVATVLMGEEHKLRVFFQANNILRKQYVADLLKKRN